MKLSIYLLFLFLAGCVGREPGSFTLRGRMEGMTDGTVKVYTYPPSNLLLDSCKVEDGKYFLTGKLEDAQLGMLFFETQEETREGFLPMIRIFLEPADLKVYSEMNDVKRTFKVEGGTLNEQLVACEQYLKSLPEYEKATELSNRIQQAFHVADMATVRCLSVVRDSLYMDMLGRLFEWKEDAARNPAVAYLCRQYSAALSGTQVREITGRFAPEFRSSYYVSQMVKYASQDLHLQPGQPFPDFRVSAPDGRPYSLADFQGKYVFVEFSASWCGWCKKEIPYIRKAYEHLKNRNVVFITMMMDTDRNQWISDIEKEHITWLCLSDLQGIKKSPMTKAYNLSGLPDSFVVDPQGKIMKRDLRGDEVLDYLSSLVDKQ